MGYVATFRKNDDICSPADIVVTETLVDVLFFPFVMDNHRLLTAAHLSVNLWKKDVPRIEPNCLLLLACLSYAEFKVYRIEHSTAEDHEEMRNIVPISTDSDLKDEIIQRLIAENAARERERERDEAKIKELERKLDVATK